VDEDKLVAAGNETGAPSEEETSSTVTFAPSNAAARRVRAKTIRIVAAAAALAVALVGAGLVVHLREAPPASGGAPAASTHNPSSIAGSSATAAPAQSAPIITKAVAVTKLESFLGRKLGQVTVSDPTEWPAGRYYEILETPPNGAVGWVDVSTGRVVYLMLPAPVTTTVTITADQAQTSAEAFFKGHDIPIDGLTATVKLQDHGCCKVYSIEWDRIENGVLLPDSRLALVDPSNGNVFSFMDRRVAYGAVPSVRIGRDEAIRLATAASGLTNPKVKSVQLLVDSSPVWPGRLVWRVELSALDPGGWVDAAMVEVDAVTGETIVAARG
jgi:hypothetical protein